MKCRTLPFVVILGCGLFMGPSPAWAQQKASDAEKGTQLF